MFKKKTMVAILILFFSFILTIPLPVTALGATFQFDAEYSTLAIGDTFVVKVSINNIDDEVGIVGWECFLHYNIDCFSLEKWEHNKPNGWGKDFDDMSGFHPESKVFICGYLHGGSPSSGVFDDNVLFTKITFKVLSKKADGEKILFKNTNVFNNNLEDIQCNEGEIIITLSESTVETSSDEISEVFIDSSSDEKSESSIDSSIDESSDNSDIDSNPNSTDKYNYSVEDSESYQDLETGISTNAILMIASVIIAGLIIVVIIIRRNIYEKKDQI